MLESRAPPLPAQPHTRHLLRISQDEVLWGQILLEARALPTLSDL